MKVDDVELRLEGLTRQEYETLDGHGKDFINHRIRLYQMFGDARLAADVLTEMAGEAGVEGVVKILDGTDKSGIEKVRMIVVDFKNSGQSDIKKYYHSVKDRLIKSSQKKPEEKQPAVERSVAGKPAVEMPSDEKPAAFEEKDEVGQPKPKSKPETHELIAGTEPTVQKTISVKDRQDAIAQELGRWQKLPKEIILKTEKDVIQKIISISDENPEIDDTKILRAIENMIQDEYHEAQFHMEALMPNHREELLKRARLL
ncbi:MAG TPA: hypothetical protein ENN13_02345 [Candidatus Altiarchaeales archaeon]|nr:hypothetical protein [Candidatus Altiarchaeales archaeon]